MIETLARGDRHLCLSVLFAAWAEIGFLVFLTVFLWRHADPMGDGMEMVGVGMAFMFIFLPFTLPALLLARSGRFLVLATALAAIGAVISFALWLELLDELHLPS
jgi:hypothetical protein